MSSKTSIVVNIDWRPDRNSNQSLSNQIINFIKEKIAQGDWLVGQKLPSQRELAGLFAVNRSTIALSLAELTAVGIIETRYGHGTTIISNTWSLRVSTVPTDWNNYIEQGIHQANIPTIQTINKLEFNEDIIRLSTGEMAPELFPHDLHRKVMNRIPDKALSMNYLEPLGLFELRRALSSHLAELGIKVSPSQILIVSGSLQALQLISLGILSPNSTVLVEEPSYLKSLHIFESTGMTLKGVPMDESGLIPWMMDDAAMKSNTSILYTIPCFQNPTSITMSADRRKNVLNWCQSHRLPIIEDDVYRDLWLETPPPAPLKAMDTTGNVLYLGSISKSLAPGMRIGWIAGPEPVVERLGDIKMQTDYGSSSLSQWALTEWVESGFYKEHLKSYRVALTSRRDHVLGLLNTYFSTLATWQIPNGGFYIWLKLKVPLSTDKLFQLGIKEKILINPGSLYSFNQNPHIRISYSYASYEDLEYGLKRLAEIIVGLA